jgi:hypothetical protein
MWDVLCQKSPKAAQGAAMTLEMVQDRNSVMLRLNH